MQVVIARGIRAVIDARTSNDGHPALLYKVLAQVSCVYALSAFAGRAGRLSGVLSAGAFGGVRAPMA